MCPREDFPRQGGSFRQSLRAKGQARKLEMDEALVGQYIDGVESNSKRIQISRRHRVSLLGDIPDLIHVREVEIDSAGERAAVLKALAAALKKLEQAREREGNHLRADMEEQIEHLKRITGELEARAAENGVRMQRAAVPQDNTGSPGGDKAADLGGIVLKGDVNEELVRLKTHLLALAKVGREREPVGKKIDFMLQEVNRELNTISSKVSHLPVVQLVLQGKERAEKIREQTQNIE